MSISVTVIDGVSGRPAEGVEVTIVGRPTEEPTLRLHGLTDEEGNFTYRPGADRLSNGEYYTVQLDVDAYFASLGMVVAYKQVTIQVRVASGRLDFRLGALITPCSLATWSLR